MLVSVMGTDGGDPADREAGGAPARLEEVRDWIEEVRDWIEGAGSVLVLTGAGISTDSGIPDYRGPQGVWTRNPGAEKMASLERYLADPEVRRRSWRGRTASPIWGAQPNPGHHALVELERRGKLSLLVTQNVDGLHLLAGTSPHRLVEIHGNARQVVCWSCGDRRPVSEALARVAAGEEDPACLLCGGILKSATISFGQPLVAGDLATAQGAARRADLVLAVGTTLSVSPACDLVPIARYHAGARVVIINNEPTAMDHLADALIRASISDVLPRLVGREPADPRPRQTGQPVP